MSAVRIILALALALVMSLTLVGCDQGLPQDEIDSIIENATNTRYDTVKLDIDMAVTMGIIGGPEEGEMTIAGDGTGVIDIVNREMQMAMNMGMDIPDVGKQVVISKIYMVGDWIYSGVEVAGLVDQWYKMEVMPGVWEQQNQLEQQIAFLESAVEIKSLPDQAVDGTDCYVFKVVPSIEALGDLLAQQSSAMGGMDFSRLDLADLFEEMTVKEWIARDSYQVLKSEVYLRMRMLPGDVGATESDFDKMTMDMNMTTKLYDYNQPVSIDLPEAALNAPEMPY